MSNAELGRSTAEMGLLTKLEIKNDARHDQLVTLWTAIGLDVATIRPTTNSN